MSVNRLITEIIHVDAKENRFDTGFADGRSIAGGSSTITILYATDTPVDTFRRIVGATVKVQGNKGFYRVFRSAHGGAICVSPSLQSR